jgi:hypothetical protein
MVVVKSVIKTEYDIIDLKEKAESKNKHIKFEIRPVEGLFSTEYFLDIAEFCGQKYDNPIKTTISVNSKKYLTSEELVEKLEDIRVYLHQYVVKEDQ